MTKAKYVTPELVGEILQRIYDSEINLAIGWLWDWGVSYSIETKTDVLGWEYEEVLHTGERDMCAVVEGMCADILRSYPNSVFAEWYRENVIVLP